MEDLHAKQFKKVHLHFQKKWDQNVRVEGVLQENKTENSYEFIYNGHTRDLLEQLVTIQFDDVTIEEPSLEEIFMHYYEKETGENDGL